MGRVLAQHVREMKRMADLLMPYTFPTVDVETDQDVLVLRQRTITIDGYDVVVSLSKANFKAHHLTSFQVQSLYSPFLPFTLVCKLVQAFLGSKDLSYIEFLKNSKKLYCWTVRTTPDGDTLPPSKEAEPSNYEGFEYSTLNPAIGDA